MSDFTPALAYLLDSEDRARGYAITGDNNGAQVVAGINQKFWPREFAAIAVLNQESRGPAVATFYYNKFWAPLMSRIQSQRVASKLLDMSVNMGFREAMTLTQRAINRFTLPNVAVDGVLGTDTINAMNRSIEEVLLASVCVECEQFYRDLVKHKPEDAPYLNGWLNRAHRVPRIAAELDGGSDLSFA